MRCVSPITTCPITTCACARIGTWECAALALLHAYYMRYFRATTCYYMLLHLSYATSGRLHAYYTRDALGPLIHTNYMRYLMRCAAWLDELLDSMRYWGLSQRYLSAITCTALLCPTGHHNTLYTHTQTHARTHACMYINMCVCVFFFCRHTLILAQALMRSSYNGRSSLLNSFSTSLFY